MTRLAHGYRCCGWTIASAFALPELARWDGAGTPDIAIVEGAAPPLDATALSTPLAQVDAAGRARYSVAGVADYLIEHGTRITVAPHPGAEAAAIRLFLLGSVLAQLCHQRGVVPLAAAAVEIDGRAVALAGSSASGRSTLAAAFWRKGYRVLSDDVAAVALLGESAQLLPGAHRIGLWADAIEALDWSARPHALCRTGIDKHSFVLPEAFAGAPLPVTAVVHLERHAASVGNAIFRRLRGQTAIAATWRHILRYRSLQAMVGAPAAVARAATLAARIPRHFLLTRPLCFADLDRTVDMIVETVRVPR